MSTVVRRLSILAVSGVVVILLAIALDTRGSTAEPQAQESTDANVPKGQTYLGSKQCASCHFDQFLTWRKTKHAQGFDILPAKYKKDASCLKCHSTGFGEATGYKDGNSALAGTTCEACHGPGSKHAEVAKPFAKKKELTKEEEALARGSIYKILPDVACLHCHEAQQHKEHPPYDKN